MPRVKRETIHKSAKSGKIVSEEFAEANPDTTFEQVVKFKKGANVTFEEVAFDVERWTPNIGQLFTKPDSEQVWELTEDGVVEHLILSGVRATVDVLMEVPEDAMPLTRAEEIARLY